MNVQTVPPLARTYLSDTPTCRTCFMRPALVWSALSPWPYCPWCGKEYRAPDVKGQTAYYYVVAYAPGNQRIQIREYRNDAGLKRAFKAAQRHADHWPRVTVESYGDEGIAQPRFHLDTSA